MPDGSPMPPALAHSLLVLATYYPSIWPGQHRLAVDMSVTRRQVNVRLRTLEDAGLIRRFRRGAATTTVYYLNLRLIRQCSRCVAGCTGRPKLSVEDAEVCGVVVYDDSDDSDYLEGL